MATAWQPATVHSHFLRIWISKFTNMHTAIESARAFGTLKLFGRQTGRTRWHQPLLHTHTHQFWSFANLIHFSQTVQRRVQTKCTPKLWWHSIHGCVENILRLHEGRYANWRHTIFCVLLKIQTVNFRGLFFTLSSVFIAFAASFVALQRRISFWHRWISSKKLATSSTLLAVENDF